jgi:MoaA/NifB/PqqE/SkfB family radical SAM enzyme
MKSYNFDGHKLLHHLDRVQEFISKGDCFPLYLEISPVGSCNHRCVFCAYDFIGYPNRKLETVRTLTLLDELAERGLRSILFAGEGEPLLHTDLGEMIKHAKAVGIDAGLFTNGQLLTSEKAALLLPSLSFIRFSFNGGNAESYGRVHQVKPDAFKTVVEAIRNAADFKRKHGLKTAIGAQFVLIPENIDSLADAAIILRDAGADYLAIKPFVQQNVLQNYHAEEKLDPKHLDTCLATAESYANETFRVIARKVAFTDYGVRHYDHCFGTSFISVINSAGDVATCLPYWDNPEFIFGNIHEHSFSDIWQGERRREIKARLEERLEVHSCPPNCRPNAVNEFLYDLKFPSVEHINFI